MAVLFCVLDCKAEAKLPLFTIYRTLFMGIKEKIQEVGIIMTKESQRQETFSGGLAVFFATLGSAVGLGNIWLFPYITGENGGAAFLLLYFGCTFLVGLPILIAEYAMGRHTRSNIVAAYQKLSGSTFWKIPGFMGVASSFFILFFYTVVAGWVYYYFFQSLTGMIQELTPATTALTFAKLSSNSILSVFCQLVVVAVTSGIIYLGVRKGIEAITKRLMPLLLVLLLICAVQALRLPNSWGGVEFLFSVNFSALTGTSVLTALGLAFFKLSLGIGTMATYASYFNKDTNMSRNAIQVVIADISVSMLAGLAIFPAVFAFGMEPSSGPGLLFMTIPLIFAKMPFGSVLVTLFFFLTASAATMAIISMIEVPVAYLMGNWKMSRKAATFMVSITVFTVGSLAALSATPDSQLGNFLIFGQTFFDSFDFLSSKLLMPLGGLCCALLMGWKADRQILKDEMTNYGMISLGWRWNAYVFLLRYVSPALVIIVFLYTLKNS